MAGIPLCEKVHLSSTYSACCRVLYSLKAVTPELTTAAEGPFVPLKLRAKVTGLRTLLEQEELFVCE